MGLRDAFQSSSTPLFQSERRGVSAGAIRGPDEPQPVQQHVHRRTEVRPAAGVPHRRGGHLRGQVIQEVRAGPLSSRHALRPFRSTLAASSLYWRL